MVPSLRLQCFRWRPVEKPLIGLFWGEKPATPPGNVSDRDLTRCRILKKKNISRDTEQLCGERPGEFQSLAGVFSSSFRGSCLRNSRGYSFVLSRLRNLPFFIDSLAPSSSLRCAR